MGKDPEPDASRGPDLGVSAMTAHAAPWPAPQPSQEQQTLGQGHIRTLFQRPKYTRRTWMQVLNITLRTL